MATENLGQMNSILVPEWDVPERVAALSSLRFPGTSRGDFAAFNIGARVGDDARAVASNRRRLAELLDAGVSLQWLEQVHGNEVVRAKRGNVEQRADAAYTTEPGVACCVTTADCLPVLFAARDGGVVAAAHAGWRGLASGVLENTLAALPAAPADVVCWLGPAIGPCHFEVGPEVRTAFLQAVPKGLGAVTSACFSPVGKHDRLMADLYGLARIRLQAAGVASITGGGHCTFCEESAFYSFRRSQRTGRMVSLVYLKS